MNGYTPDEAKKLLFEGAKFYSFQKILKAQGIDYLDYLQPRRKKVVYDAEE
jgi:hypothetical protein